MLAPSPELNETFRLVALRGGLGAVPGVRLAGVHAGLKKRKRDLALIAFDEPQNCASVTTTNEIKAAPLLVSAQHLEKKSTAMRALVCNSGCANACTGERGKRDAHATARQAGALLGIAPEQVIVASTGVIGVPLPMDRMAKGLERAAHDLESGGEAAFDAAEAIMTTDRVSKLAAYAFYDGEQKYVVGGIAKGSGMIAPNMATMLAFIATDAPMPREELQRYLTEACDASFNMISVDGDMSTNDAVYAFAPEPAEGRQTRPHAPPSFKTVLDALCLDLARAMVADGEGATKTLTVEVTSARTTAQARTIARAIVNSSLVKTALYGEDPELGPHHRRGGIGALRHGRRRLVALAQRPIVGRPRRNRSPFRSRSAPASRAIIRNRPLGSRCGFRRRNRLGLRFLDRLRANQRELPHVSLLQNYNRAPVTFVAGEGCELIDTHGRRYLDMIGGIAVCALGHAHPEIARAVSDQAKRLVHCSNLFGHEPAESLAAQLAQRSGLDRVFFCNSGAEANEAAIKLARKYAYRNGRLERNEIVYCSGSFHGRTLGALAATANAAYREGFGPLPAGFRETPFNDAAALRASITDTVAAFIVEPVQGESGVIPAHRAFLECARELCRQRGALLIFDEIQCGMGRLGPLFAFERYGVDPDVVTLAKSLANGLPIGAMLVHEKYAGGLQPGDHGSTFGGSPIPCAAALAHLRVRDRLHLEQRVGAISQMLFDRLRDLAKEFPGVYGLPRGAGLLIGVPVQAGVDASAVVAEIRENSGVLFGTAGGNTIRLAPPLIITMNEIDLAVNALRRFARSRVLVSS